MRRTIVLCGNSPLLFFLAKELDSTLAQGVENKVVWLTTERYLSDIGVNSHWLNPKKKILLSEHLSYVKIVRTATRSINTLERRLVTDKGVIDYDLIFIDQLATYQFEELMAVAKAVTDLALAVKAKQNQGRSGSGVVVCNGDGAETLQLAARLRELVTANFPRQARHIRIESAILPNQTVARQFMKKISVGEEGASTGTRLVIAAPRPYVTLSKIRGLKVGLKKEPLLEVDGRAHGKDSVILLGNRYRQWQTLWHVQRTLAKRLAANLELMLDRQQTRPLELLHNAYSVTAMRHQLVELGGLLSAGVRAHAIVAWEKRLFGRLRSK